MYGNAPFAFAGFETDEGKRFALVLDDAKSGTLSLKELESLQGTHLELTGKIRGGTGESKAGINRLKDGEFVVFSYRLLE